MSNENAQNKLIEYVNKAQTEGRTSTHSANGINYVFVEDTDGWLSVVEITNGQYYAHIQAADLQHALAYISRVEPVTVPLTAIYNAE